VTAPGGDGTGRRGAWWRAALKILVSTALMLFLFRRISMPELMRLVRELHVEPFAGAIVCFFLSNLLGSRQWHRLLTASGIQLSFRRAFRFYFVGLFFNNFLPANVGGDAVKVYDVSRIGSSVYQVIAVTLLDRIIGIFSLCMLACVAAVYLMNSDSMTPYGYYLVVFAACMVPAVGLYFFKPLGTLIRRLVSAIRPLSIDVRMSAVIDHLSEFKSRKDVIVQVIGLSLVIQALRVFTHVLVGVSLGIHIDSTILSQFFVFVPLLSLAMIPPITINGLGIREGLGILLFARAGLAETDAFALEFLTWVVSVGVSLLGLAFFLARRQDPAADRAKSF
jgi:uncharacterized protein (TIRG00374 family)